MPKIGEEVRKMNEAELLEIPFTHRIKTLRIMEP
jgi:hypothetical protein